MAVVVSGTGWSVGWVVDCVIVNITAAVGSSTLPVSSLDSVPGVSGCSAVAYHLLEAIEVCEATCVDGCFGDAAASFRIVPWWHEPNGGWIASDFVFCRSLWMSAADDVSAAVCGSDSSAALGDDF